MLEPPVKSKNFEISYDQGEFRLSRKGNFIMYLTLAELFELGQLITKGEA